MVSVTFLGPASAADTITPNLSLINPQKLISSSQGFELGFFSPGGSNRSYLGIWHRTTPSAIVWVANRENPVSGPSGTLALTEGGVLLILDGRNITIWTSNTSGTAKDPIALLLDSGNFVIKERGNTDSESYIWQSFNVLLDTLLPGMKMLSNSIPGKDRYLTSSRSSTDPSKGELTYQIENLGLPQFLLRKGLNKIYRSGPWNGLRVSGYPISVRSSRVFKVVFVHGPSESHYMFQPIGNIITRLTLDQSGSIQRLVLNKEEGNEWQLMYKFPSDMCDEYGQCGPNGICRINQFPICDCLPGFTPKSQSAWEVMNWVNGCERRVNLSCHKGEDIIKLAGVKLPDLLNFSVNESMGIRECRMECLNNCSCSAYTNSNIRNGGSGCLMWFGDLIDIKVFNKSNSEQDLYIRVAASELGIKFVDLNFIESSG